MKKSVTLILLALVCMLALSACGCKHETRIEADCVTPKTCAECGETEGEALGHTWVDATCEVAKTCSVCSETEGEALGHAWADATCEEPKTCSACSLTEGEALGHIWLDATTEAPKTCETCAATEGERIITDSRFTTASTIDLHGTWVNEETVTGEMMGMPGFDGSITARSIMEFGNDGTLTYTMELDMDEEFSAVMAAYMAEEMYTQLAAEGYSREQADALMVEECGMTVAEYCTYMMQSVDMTEMMSSLLGAVNVTEVYYVEDGVLYTAMTWTAKFTSQEFTLDGDTLTLATEAEDGTTANSIYTRQVPYTP